MVCLVLWSSFRNPLFSSFCCCPSMTDRLLADALQQETESGGGGGGGEDREMEGQRDTEKQRK